MSLKKILVILAAGFVVSFLAVPAFRMMVGTPAIIPGPGITESGTIDVPAPN